MVEFVYHFGILNIAAQRRLRHFVVRDGAAYPPGAPCRHTFRGGALSGHLRAAARASELFWIDPG